MKPEDNRVKKAVASAVDAALSSVQGSSYPVVSKLDVFIALASCTFFTFFALEGRPIELGDFLGCYFLFMSVTIAARKFYMLDRRPACVQDYPFADKSQQEQHAIMKSGFFSLDHGALYIYTDVEPDDEVAIRQLMFDVTAHLKSVTDADKRSGGVIYFEIGGKQPELLQGKLQSFMRALEQEGCIPQKVTIEYQVGIPYVVNTETAHVYARHGFQSPEEFHQRLLQIIVRFSDFLNCRAPKAIVSLMQGWSMVYLVQYAACDLSDGADESESLIIRNARSILNELKTRGQHIPYFGYASFNERGMFKKAVCPNAAEGAFSEFLCTLYSPVRMNRREVFTAQHSRYLTINPTVYPGFYDRLGETASGRLLLVRTAEWNTQTVSKNPEEVECALTHLPESLTLAPQKVSDVVTLFREPRGKTEQDRRKQYTRLQSLLGKGQDADERVARRFAAIRTKYDKWNNDQQRGICNADPLAMFAMTHPESITTQPSQGIMPGRELCSLDHAAYGDFLERPHPEVAVEIFLKRALHRYVSSDVQALIAAYADARHWLVDQPAAHAEPVSFQRRCVIA
jgi:hypothetical protein